MRNFFRFTAKYNDMGKALKVDYLVEACNYTEAEARATREIESFANGDVVITNIRPVNYEDLLPASAGALYEVFSECIALNEYNQTEKRVKHKHLVVADSVGEALVSYVNYMKNTLSDYEVTGVKKTSYLNLFVTH